MINLYSIQFLLSINQQEDDYHFFVYFKINESFSELFKVKNFKKNITNLKTSNTLLGKKWKNMIPFPSKENRGTTRKLKKA